jgi:phage tail sheath gpL-like
MDPLLIVAIVGGALLVGSFGVPKVKEYFAGKKAGADLTLDPIAALKELFSTTETKVLSATPTRAIAVSLLIHFEPVVDALPNEAAKASCHAAIKTLITEIGDPTPVASKRYGGNRLLQSPHRDQQSVEVKVDLNLREI